MPAEIVVAAVTQTGLILGIWVTYRLNRKTHQIVKGNGKGDVAYLSEQNYLMLGRIEGKLDAHIEDRRAHN